MLFQNLNSYRFLIILSLATFCFAGKAKVNVPSFQVMEGFKLDVNSSQQAFGEKVVHEGIIAVNQYGDFQVKFQSQTYTFCEDKGTCWLLSQRHIAQNLFRSPWLLHGDSQNYLDKYAQLCMDEYKRFKHLSQQGFIYKGKLFRFNWFHKFPTEMNYGYVFYAKSKDECYQKITQIFGQEAVAALRPVF